MVENLISRMFEKDKKTNNNNNKIILLIDINFILQLIQSSSSECKVRASIDRIDVHLTRCSKVMSS